MKELIKQMEETEKLLDNPNNFICSCGKISKNGYGYYCFKHKKQTSNDKKKVKLYEKEILNGLRSLRK